MPAHPSPEVICQKLNELSQGTPPQHHWHGVNWTHDAASGTYRSNAVAPASLVDISRDKLECDDTELFPVSMAPEAGNQLAMTEHLAGVIADDRESQIRFQSAVFGYSPTGTAAYLGGLMGGSWSYNPRSGAYDGEFALPSDPTGIEGILSKHSVRAKAVYTLSIPDSELIELREDKDLVCKLHANGQRLAAGSWSAFVAKGSEASKGAAKAA